MAGPYNFEPQSKSLRTLVLAPFKQAAWGTALSDASLTRIQRFDGAAVLDLMPTRRTDANMSGKGTYFATNGQITMWDLKISGVKCELSDWLAGWILAFCLGKETVTGSAAPYTHTCAFDESTRQAVPTTAYLVDTNGLSYKVLDLSPSTCTFTISETGSIEVEFDLMGTGQMVEPYTMVAPPAVPTENYILGSDCSFTLTPSGNAAIPLIGRHRTTTLKLDWQSTVHKGPGGGLYGMFIRKGRPKFSLSSTIAAAATDDILTLLQNNTKAAFSLLANSGAAAQFGISLPAANLKTAKMGFEDDMVTWNIECDETTSYQLAGVPPITLTAINSTPSYLMAGV